MVEDKILVWKFNRGSKDALRSIYEKYKDDLFGLAVSLLRDRSVAQDVVHLAVVGVDTQRGLELPDGLFQPALLPIGHAQVVVRLG